MEGLRLDAWVQLLAKRAGAIVGRAEDDLGRVEEVGDRGALAQELGVTDVADPFATE